MQPSAPDTPARRELQAYDEASYESQLAHKLERFACALGPQVNAPLEVFRSPASGYRMRCEFRIWQTDERAAYVMFNKGSRVRYEVQSFAPATPPIQALMPGLLAAINANDALRRRLFRVDFLCASSGEILVTLVYHKRLDEAWESAARDLHAEFEVSIVGRSKGQKQVVGYDYVTEQLTVMGKTYHYRQFEGAFTQPNARVNEHMLTWVSAQAAQLSGDLLELYCGNGNFTAVVAQHFERLLATEISKTSISALTWALEANGIDNVAHARLSAQEVTQALDKVRPFRRLAHLDLQSYNFSTVLVDPPRAGVDSETLKLLARFDNILYVSCNPETLSSNLGQLRGTHQASALAAFDQFPYTEHLESAVLLSRV
jgi:tRNA (uracil-5-)-methyltransferase